MGNTWTLLEVKWPYKYNNKITYNNKKCHPIMSNVIHSLDVMTTNVTKEKLEYLAFTFISDHLQKDLKKKKRKQMISKFNMRLSK